jgi:hypothetical protein
MNQRILEDLYDATEEDLLYGVGLLALPEQEPAPFIHIHYRDWSREQLEVVRESCRGGLVLTFSRRAEDTRDLHLSTRERIGIQASESGRTSALHAPAWDAHLTGVGKQVVRRFESGRRRCGGFLLLMQTREREFLTAVDDLTSRTAVGVIQPRALPGPAAASRGPR